MFIIHKPLFWLKENLPYPSPEKEHLNAIREPAKNGGYDDLPYNQVTTPCISTSYYRFLPTEDGDSVFMNTHQPDSRLKEFFGVKKEGE
jgi:predicted secreted protein